MKIILLGGKANSGKDSTAEYIDEYYRSRGLDVVNIQIAYYIYHIFTKFSRFI